MHLDERQKRQKKKTTGKCWNKDKSRSKAHTVINHFLSFLSSSKAPELLIVSFAVIPHLALFCRVSDLIRRRQKRLSWCCRRQETPKWKAQYVMQSLKSSLTWMCGDPKRWTSSALSLEYLWLVADCMEATASRQRFMPSPGGARDGDITCELMRSKSLRNCDKGKRKENETIVAHHAQEFAQLIFTISLNLPATLCGACCPAASRWACPGRFLCLAALRHRRGCRESSAQPRCQHPRQPTRSNSPRRSRQPLIRRKQHNKVVMFCGHRRSNHNCGISVFRVARQKKEISGSARAIYRNQCLYSIMDPTSRHSLSLAQRPSICVAH